MVLFLIHGSNKSENQKEKPTQLSTLNHSHAVAAPQRDSSTHHTLLHHSKVLFFFGKFSIFDEDLLYYESVVNIFPLPTSQNLD
jgi:hypothetical protein